MVQIGTDTLCCVTKPQLVKINTSINELNTNKAVMEKVLLDLELCNAVSDKWQSMYRDSRTMYELEVLKYNEMQDVNYKLMQSLALERKKKIKIGIGVGVGCTLLGASLGVLIMSIIN